MKKMQLAAAAAALFVGAAGSAQAQLVFNNSILAGTSDQAVAGFLEAQSYWSAILKDNVIVNLQIGTAVLGNANVIGQTGSTRQDFTYSATRAAMVADAKSANDALAVANLQAGPNFGMLINRTTNNPNGANSATAYYDNTGANTNDIWMTTANAKALGMLGATSALDGQVTFNSAFSFDYDRSNGITAGQMDFVGVAIHEIGHALGFVSGVDYVDFYAQASQTHQNDDWFEVVNTLDLFRYSAASAALGAIDLTASTTAKYFSLDGGVTMGPGFSTGAYFGDGRQASHWKDNLGLGIMDPTFAYGEFGVVGANDVMAFDVIGWDVATPVPEPSTYAMFGLGLAAVAFVRRRKQQAA